MTGAAASRWRLLPVLTLALGACAAPYAPPPAPPGVDAGQYARDLDYCLAQADRDSGQQSTQTAKHALTGALVGALNGALSGNPFAVAAGALQGVFNVGAQSAINAAQSNNNGDRQMIVENCMANWGYPTPPPQAQ